MIERWIIADARTLTYEATLEDPAVFARPWTINARPFTPVEQGYEQWEDACVEGNRSLDLILER